MVRNHTTDWSTKCHFSWHRPATWSNFSLACCQSILPESLEVHFWCVDLRKHRAGHVGICIEFVIPYATCCICLCRNGLKIRSRQFYSVRRIVRWKEEFSIDEDRNHHLHTGFQYILEDSYRWSHQWDLCMIHHLSMDSENIHWFLKAQTHAKYNPSNRMRL